MIGHGARLAAASATVALMLVVSSCSGGSVADGGVGAMPTTTADAGSLTPVTGAPSAPQREARLLDGTTIDLDDLWRGRTAVLQFTATWCTQCAAAETDLEEIADEYGDGVVVARITGDEGERAVRAYVDDHHVTGPVITDADGSLQRAYAVTEPPVTVVIDSDGGIVTMRPGGATGAEIRAALDQAITRG